MATILVCDGCGESIDSIQEYYTGAVTVVKSIDGVLTTVKESRSFDFHPDHFPINLEASDTGQIVPPGQTEENPVPPE